MSNCELTDSNFNYQSSIPVIVLPCTDKVSDQKTLNSFSSPIYKKSINNDSVDIETHTIANNCLNNYRDGESKEMTKNERKMAFRNQGGRIL